jgi:hypothetical protein
MKSSPSLASRRSCTSTSSSNKEKHQGITKLQGHLVTTTISAATLNKCTTSTPMVVSLRRIGKRILDHLRSKEAKEPLSKGQISITTEGACKAEAVVMAEAPTHSSLCTACTMAVKPTIAQKTAPSSSSPKERWSKIPTSLYNNHCLERLTTQCNGLCLTTNILRPTLRSSCHKPTKTASSLPILPLCHNQPPTTFTGSTNNIPSISFIDHLPNAKKHKSSKQTRNQSTPPPPLQICEPPQQTKSFPTHGIIVTINKGSNTDFDNNRQQRDYYR